MTVSSFFGCLLTAYGAPLAVFFLSIAKDAQHVILAITSAFFWLVSILLSSAIWYAWWSLTGATLPMAAIGVGVALQELARYGFFVLYAKSEKGLSVISRIPNSPMNRPEHAFVAGFGFGIISGLTMYITQLAESWGPGVILCNSCPSVDLFFVSAMQTCVFIFLHIVWTMVMFDGFLTRQWWKPVYVVLTHYGASFSTLLVPSNIMGGCTISIAICVAILMVTTFLAVRPVFKIIKGA